MAKSKPIQKEEDPINPDHYPKIAGVKPYQIMQEFPTNLGQVIKYIWRCGRKKGEHPITALMKARNNLDYEIERLQLKQLEGEPSKAGE